MSVPTHISCVFLGLLLWLLCFYREFQEYLKSEVGCIPNFPESGSALQKFNTYIFG